MKRITVLAVALSLFLIVPLVAAQAVAPGAQKPGEKPEPKPETKSEAPRSTLPMEPAELAPAEALFYLGVTDLGETWAACSVTSRPPVRRRSWE